MNVGEVLASELQGRTGIEAVASDLTYDLAAGEPDMLDSMVATTFANVAMDLIRDGIGGRMVAVRDGKYDHVSLAETRQAAAAGPARGAYDTVAVPAQVRRPGRRPAAPDPVLGRRRRGARSTAGGVSPRGRSGQRIARATLDMSSSP